MIDPSNTSILNRSVVSNRHSHRCRSIQEGAEEDSILHYQIRRNCWFVYRIALHAASRASAGGRESVPVLHLVIDNIEGVALIRGDIIREEVSPRLMRHVVNIDA